MARFRRPREDSAAPGVGTAPDPGGIGPDPLTEPAPAPTQPESLDVPPGPDGGLPPEPEAPAPRQVAVPRTRVATIWTSLIFGLIFLIVILIFIFQNLQSVQVSFITLSGRFPLALCLLFAAILGALIVLSLGTVRIVQLRRLARRNLRSQPPA
ncbi:MAG: lipopolysaccharide assembly protein LapA domain-containing protein [Acidimicrobiales bacterium]